LTFFHISTSSVYIFNYFIVLLRKRLRYLKYNPFPKEMQAFLKNFFDLFVESQIKFTIFTSLTFIHFFKEARKRFHLLIFQTISS
jgi:hypothetical protein